MLRLFTKKKNIENLFVILVKKLLLTRKKVCEEKKTVKNKKCTH